MRKAEAAGVEFSRKDGGKIAVEAVRLAMQGGKRKLRIEEIILAVERVKN
jgi:hypothetical protein